MPERRIRLAVDNTAKPKRARKRPGFSPWECRVCEVDIGVTSRALVKVRLYAEQGADLSIKGGHAAWVCATCMARGKVTVVTA